MARLLIEVETKGVVEARREMGQLETSIKGVEGTSKTGAQGLDDMLKSIGQMKVEASNLGKVNEQTTKSFTSMIAETGAARIALLGVGTAFAGLLAESARYYVAQQGYIENHKRGIGEMALAWSNFRYRVGEALIGSEQDMGRHLSVMARFVNSAGSMLAGLIRATGAAGGSAAGTAGMLGFGYGQDVVSILSGAGGPMTNPTARRASNIMLTATTGAAAWGGSSALGPNGLPLDAIDQAWARDRARIEESFNKALESASERRRRAEERAASEAERLASRWAYVSQTTRGLPSGVIDNSTAIFDPFLAPPAYLPSSPLPGGGLNFLPTLGMGGGSSAGGGSWLSSIFGRSGLGSQAMSLLTGTGLLTRNSAVGRSIGGAMTGFGLGAGVSGMMSSLVGASVWGPLAPIAAGVGAAIPFLSSLFGPSAKAREDAAVQPQIDQLIAQVLSQYGGREGLAAAGNRVGVDVVGAFGSRGKQGYSELSSLIDELAKKQGDLNGRLAEQASLEAQIAALKKSQEFSWQAAAEAAQTYGISVETLGTQFQQLKSTDVAQKLLSDFEMLTKNGADVGGVLYGMREEISRIVQESVKFGTAIPENMRPLVEELARSGNLLDINGNAIADLAGLKWGDRVATEAEKITSAIEDLTTTLRELMDSIKNDFPNAVKQGVDEGQRIIDGIVWEVPPIGIDALGVSTGGYITAGGVMYASRGGRVPGRPRGTDTVPAWLTPGEYVMNADAVNRIGVGNLQRMNSGSSTFNVGGIHIDARESTFDNPAAAERMADRIERVLMTRIRPQLHYSRY